MFSQDRQVRPRVSVFQRLGEVNEPKERNIQVREKKKWKMNKKRQRSRSFLWVREQNEVELVDQVNVISIGDEEDIQNFELPWLESPRHQKIATIDIERCGEVQAQDDSPECLDDSSIPIEQEPCQDFVEAIQASLPEIEDGGQATIDELQKIDLGTTEDPKPIFVSAMLNDEELAQYEQLLQEYKDVFAWGYQDMSGLDPNVAIQKLAVSEGVKPIKQPQRRFRPELTIQINAEVDKLIRANFIREVQYPIWLANIIPVRKKNGQLRICVDSRDLNNACPKDDFPLPITELLVDATTGFGALSFMDGFLGYNQIKMNPEDEEPFGHHRAHTVAQ